MFCGIDTQRFDNLIGLLKVYSMYIVPACVVFSKLKASHRSYIYISEGLFLASLVSYPDPNVR